QRAARPLRTQPEIDAPREPVLRHVVERAGEPLRHPCEVLVQRLLTGRALVRLVEEQEVDVAAAIELAPAELPHAEHGHRHPLAVASEWRTEPRLRPALRLREGDLDRDLSEIRELP